MKRAVPAALLLVVGQLPASALDRDCFARVRLAEGAGFVKSYRNVDGGLEVVVSEEIWNNILLPSKQGLIRTLNCALRREGREFPRIFVRSDVSHELLGEARRNELTVP